MALNFNTPLITEQISYPNNYCLFLKVGYALSGLELCFEAPILKIGGYKDYELKISSALAAFSRDEDTGLKYQFINV